MSAHLGADAGRTIQGFQQHIRPAGRRYHHTDARP